VAWLYGIVWLRHFGFEGIGHAKHDDCHADACQFGEWRFARLFICGISEEVAS
jgi:hypothetical protein